MSSILEYKCPACGGILEFNSGIQKMKCPYCDTEFEMETLKEMDEILEQMKPEAMEWEEPTGQWEESDNMGVYRCESCGGELVTDVNTAATSCPYCGNPVVMTQRLAGDLKPDYVIPFKLDKKAAKEGLKKHFKGKVLLPKVFKDENHIDEVKGIYVPFWLFDADADADIQYSATRIRTWSDSRYDYTETSYYSIFRRGDIGFQRVPVDGSSKMEDGLMESLEPYHYSDAVDFQTAYLAGYLADRYDVPAEQSVQRANERIKRSTEDAFAKTVRGYATVVPKSSNVRLTNGKEKYALFPVWILNTTWRGKKYTFAMNGQTGKFVGDLPVDKSAYWRWWGLITAIAGIVITGGIWLAQLL